MDGQENAMQKRLERMEQEVQRLRESERAAKLEAGLASAWGQDFPTGDKADYLRVLAERRWSWNSEKGEYQDRLGAVKDFKAWRRELEDSNEIFARKPAAEEKPTSNKQRISRKQFQREAGKNPEMLEAIAAGRIEVED